MIKLKFEDIDKNFAVSNIIPDDIIFCDCFNDPFVINGLYLDDAENIFTRMPFSYKEKTDNEGVKVLLHHTSGGRIKFATSSPYIAVSVELASVELKSHMPATGHSGMDVYVAKKGSKNYKYVKSFFPPNSACDICYTGFLEFNQWDDFNKREVLLNLPLYNGVKSVKVGIKKGEKLYSPVPYAIDTPVYYYGSSITQGGCASRPGNTYMAHISRWLDCDFCNLGFAGNAKGENEMAEYIASKNMSAFVFDYDANAPSVEHYENTHYPFYKIIRDKHPCIPIILLSFPRFDKRPEYLQFGKDTSERDLRVCNQIVLKTYLKALEEGDENIYYIDGATVFGTEDQDACTVDNCHPNDLGFYRMAKAICPVLKKAFRKKGIL